MLRTLLRTYFTMSLILLVMLVLTVPFVDFQSAAGAIVKLNLLILVPTCAGSGALLYREVRREEEVYRPDEWEQDESGTRGHDTPWDQE